MSTARDLLAIALAKRYARENLPAAVADWLAENLTPTTPPVDATLSIQGAAADAKKTGKEIAGLKSAVNQIANGDQILNVFSENIVSGTRSKSFNFVIPAGTYELSVGSLTSSDTQYTTSRIIFYTPNGNTAVDIPRGNTPFVRTITLPGDTTSVSFYGAHNYSDSNNIDFQYSNVAVRQSTQLKEKLDSLESKTNRIGNVDFSTLTEILLEGSGTLESSDFEQGYMSNGSGWISTGSGDSLKYITFRCDAKLLQGSTINVNCPEHYCSIDLYSDNNWNSDSVRLEHIDYAQEINYAMSNDGYIAISIATSRRYADRVAITPSDYAESISIMPMTPATNKILAELNRLPLKSGTPYFGERVDVAGLYCAAERYFTMTHTTTESIQGAACYGKYLFQFMDRFSGCAIYDLESKSLVQLIETQSVATYHCNNANFGNEFYDANDVFPLLYVSQENILEYKVTVFRVTKANGVYGLALVQTITWEEPSTISCYYPNAIIDTENNRIIQYGAKNNSWHSDSPGNMLRFNIYNLPALSAGNVTLTESERLDHFDLEMVQAPQGAIYKNGKIYMAFGLISDYQIRAISVSEKRYVSMIDLTKPALSDIVGTEQEGVFIYDGQLCCTNVNKVIWKLLT